MEYILTPEGELCHYGVKGMKWGVRRYQNADGSLTAAGKKRARQEYRADNKTAYELGKKATIAGHATAKSMKRTIKYENRLEKKYANDPDGQKGSTNRLRRKWEASAKTTEGFGMVYAAYKNKAEQHCQSLIDKYGSEAVSSIKYKDKKLPAGKESPSKVSVMNERTNNLSDYARAGARTVASFGLSTAMDLPVAVVFAPKTTGEKGRYAEQVAYYQNLRDTPKRSANKNTRVSGQEEADFWKALAEEELKKQRG